MDGVSNAKQTLDAADNGISAITQLVESAQAVARQAEQAPATVNIAGVYGKTIVNDTNATVTGSDAIASDGFGLTGTAASGLNTDDTAAMVMQPM